MVAQPPFSMTDRRFHDETLLNSANFAGASAWCWNFSTQIGASTATTAVSARWVAIRSAVLPSVHPSDENPTTATQQRRPLHPIPLVSLRVDLHFVTLAWEKGLLRFQINQEPIACGGPAKIESETTQTTPARLDCRYRRQCLSTRRWGALLPRKPVKITIAPSRARSQAMSRPSLSSLRRAVRCAKRRYI